MDEELKPAKRRELTSLHYEFPLEHRDSRCKELILYIAHECVDDPRFSKLKLFKILFYADFESYGRYRVPITGMPYRKAPYGPAPAMFSRLEEEMIRDRLISIVTRRVMTIQVNAFSRWWNPPLNFWPRVILRW